MAKSREHVTTDGRAVFYACMWNDLRQIAMEHGWALALHGSLANDMDIMAMPWTEEATDDETMILALRSAFTAPEGIGWRITDKHNHRRVYTLSIFADFYLDINIIRTPERSTPAANSDAHS